MPTEIERRSKQNPSLLRCIFDVSSILNNVPSKASWPNESLFENGVLQSQRSAYMLCLLIFSCWRRPTRILNFMERRRIAPPQPSWMVQRRLQKKGKNLLYRIFGAS